MGHFLSAEDLAFWHGCCLYISMWKDKEPIEVYYGSLICFICLIHGTQDANPVVNDYQLRCDVLIRGFEEDKCRGEALAYRRGAGRQPLIFGGLHSVEAEGNPRISGVYCGSVNGGCDHPPCLSHLSFEVVWI